MSTSAFPTHSVFTLSSPPQTNVLHKPDEYYSVHVNFVTHDPKKIVHEEYLHKLFSEFGGIVDIAIRRYFRQHRRQYGYAFVDYYERSSANNAAAKLANVNIEGIRIQATVGHRSVDAVHDSGNMSANSSTTTRDSIDQQDHFKGSFEDSHFNQASETRSPVGIEQVHSQRRYDKSSASIMPPNNIILQTPPTFIGNAAKNESHHGHSGLTIFPPVPIFYPPPQLMQPVNMVNHQENPHHSQSYHSQSYYPQPPHTPFSNQTPAATGNKMISNNQTNFNHAVPVPYMYNVVPPSYDGYSAAPMHQTMYYAVGSNPDGTIVYFPIPAAPMYPTYSTINS